MIGSLLVYGVLDAPDATGATVLLKIHTQENDARVHAESVHGLVVSMFIAYDYTRPAGAE